MELVPGTKIDLSTGTEIAGRPAGSLVYVSDRMNGLYRTRNDSGFIYHTGNGREIDDPETLKRISSLVIPPAWEKVWVCSRSNGHLQATGIDQKGRKQYRYHTLWNNFRNERKYIHMLEFGKKLPLLREKINTDLHKKGLPEEKVIALVLSIMQKTLIRIGNEVYADLYHSYGLTTMRNRHVMIKGERINFHFKGKKGVEHSIELKDPRLSRLLRKIKDLSGQELFQYIGADGQRRSLDSGQVNAYLHEVCGGEFSAKDIRTWSGTAYMLHLLAQSPPAETEMVCKKTVVELLDKVAEHLGNTRTVCRKYYVHPGLISAYEQHVLGSYIQGIGSYDDDPIELTGLSPTEHTLLRFLEDLAGQGIKDLQQEG